MLRIRIDKYLDLNATQAPRVPARIFSINASGKSNTASAIRASVPISHHPGDTENLQLPEGKYYVETVLPTGEILADTVQLTTADETLVLQAEHSPHEWLSWQQLSGNLKSSVSTAPAPPVTAGVGKKRSAAKARPTRSGATSGFSATSTSGTTKAVVKRKSASIAPPTRTEPPKPAGDPLPIGRPIQVLSNPVPSLVQGAPGSADVWKWLGEAKSADAFQLIHQLNNNSNPVDLQAYTTDGVRAVYRVSLKQTPQNDVRALEPSVAPAPRYFAVVPRRSRIELLSLPIPWRVISTGQEAGVEVATQQIHAPDEFCSSLVARDEELGMLLGFLSSGSMPTVRQMAETAQEMLYYKFENPFAAAAGGYALVGTAQETKTAEWHEWIGNLMNRFPHIPDGAIQWAQLRLRIRKSASDVDEARKALKLAYTRGLPFYSMGIKWLMEGLEWISNDDEEAKQMLNHVRRVAWLVNFQQPFTIVRVGGQPDV
jgi:hypothetical protein